MSKRPLMLQLGDGAAAPDPTHPRYHKALRSHHWGHLEGEPTREDYNAIVMLAQAYIALTCYNTTGEKITQLRKIRQYVREQHETNI